MTSDEKLLEPYGELDMDNCKRAAAILFEGGLTISMNLQQFTASFVRGNITGARFEKGIQVFFQGLEVEFDKGGLN